MIWKKCSCFNWSWGSIRNLVKSVNFYTFSTKDNRNGVHVVDCLSIGMAFLRPCPNRSTYSCSWPMGWESGIRGCKLGENEEMQCSSVLTFVLQIHWYPHQSKIATRLWGFTLASHATYHFICLVFVFYTIHIYIYTLKTDSFIVDRKWIKVKKK